ncbi:MAG TPA: hypothetical protein VNB64_06060 [Solirubrobacteraceae bacterium]|nr:hypothetical protein [Solirubrobacteraceae bacterium]
MTEPAYEDTPGTPEDETRRSLEERLRRLEWPAPPPGVRERTLEELKRKLAELSSSNGHGAAAEAEDPAPDRDRSA